MKLKLFVLVVLCSIVVTILVSISRPQSYRGQQRQTKSFKLELCDCTRTLVIPVIHLTSTAKINTSTLFPQQIGFNSTTCGWSAYQRGSHQKIISFSFYGNLNSSVHNAKQYFVDIQYVSYICRYKTKRRGYGFGYCVSLLCIVMSFVKIWTLYSYIFHDYMNRYRYIHTFLY